MSSEPHSLHSSPIHITLIRDKSISSSGNINNNNNINSSTSHYDQQMVIDEVLRCEQFESYKIKIDIRNALISVFDGGNTLLSASSIFKIDHDRLNELYCKIVMKMKQFPCVESKLILPPSKQIEVVNQSSKRSVSKKQRLHLSNRKITTNCNAKSLEECTNKKKIVLKIVLKSENSSENSKDLHDESNLLRADDPRWSGQTMNHSSYQKKQLLSEQLYEEEVIMEDIMKEESEIDVTSVEEKIKDDNDDDCVIGYADIEEEDEDGEIVVTDDNDKQKEHRTTLISEIDDVIPPTPPIRITQPLPLITIVRSTLNKALDIACEKSPIPDNEIAKMKPVLVELITNTHMSITEVSEESSIPRSRLSSYMGKLRKILNLPINRNTYRVMIMEDATYMNNNKDDKASIKEITDLVNKRLSRCHSDNRIRLIRCVIRVVSGQATVAEAADDEHVHGLNVWRYVTIIRNILGERAPSLKKKMRPFVNGGRVSIIRDNYGNPVQRRYRSNNKRMKMSISGNDIDMEGHVHDDLSSCGDTVFEDVSLTHEWWN